MSAGAWPTARTGGVLKAVLGVLAAVGLGFGLPVVAALLAFLVVRILRLPDADFVHDPSLSFLYVQHGIQLVLALAVIFGLKRLVPTDYGLHMPRGRSYVGSAVLWGIAFGVLMLLVDHAPQLLAHTKPSLDYPLSPSSVSGWMAFEWLFVGPTEEIPLRSMLVPFLIAMWPARLKLGRFEMHWAGIVLALVFALLHATNFASRTWPEALGQQVYAFVLGVLYAYWLEKSRSVLAPSISHNVGDGVEYTLVLVWIALT